MVFYDEIDLAPGRFRMKTGGGAAGNNGIRSITAHIGPDFRRARLGTGHPGAQGPGAWATCCPTSTRSTMTGSSRCSRPAPTPLPLLAAGEDEKYQTEVMRLAPAEKADPRASPSPLKPQSVLGPPVPS